MFNRWLKSNRAYQFDLTAPLFPAADDREFWGGIDGDDYIRRAEPYLGYEWPMIRASQYIAYANEGNRRAMEDPHFMRRSALCALVLGEIAEHKGRFIPDIVDGMFAICEESFWGVSAHSVCRNIPDGVESVRHIDLFAAETGTLLAVTCYMLRSELEEYCSEIITRCEIELRRRITEPYAARTDFFWMGYGYPVNNWNGWILSNVLTVYLLVEKDKTKLSNAVNKMLSEINRLYEAYPDDGGCDEGACYWTVSGGCIFEFCDLLYVASAGKINFFDDEKLRRIGKYIVRSYIGDGYFVNFADGTPKVTHSTTGLFYMMGLRTGDADYLALAGESLRCDPERDNITPMVERDAKIKRRLYEMMYKADIANAPDLVLPETDIFEKLQVALLRDSGWTVAVKGGHNDENHNHNDVGSFIAYCDRTPVLVDPSCGTYVGASFKGNRFGIWTNRSDWHNTPEINGEVQSEGNEYSADSFSLDGNAVSVSFAGAYPESARVSELSRSVVICDGCVVVKDSVILNGKGTVTENFITPYSVTVNDGRAVIDGRFVLECDTHASVTADSVDFLGDDKLTLYWKSDDMKRVRFTFDVDGAVNVRFTMKRI